MSEWRKLVAYYIESDDGRSMMQMAENKEHARVNAIVMWGRRVGIVTLRRATKSDVANWRAARDARP